MQTASFFEDVGYADIILVLGASLDMYTVHLEYASQLGFLWQFATHSLLPVYSQLYAL